MSNHVDGDEILERITQAGLNANGKLLAHVIWALNSDHMPGVEIIVDWDVVIPLLQEWTRGR